MSRLDPEYGSTPLPHDELEALLTEARADLPQPITRAVVYGVEQAVEAGVREECMAAVLDDQLQLEDILSDDFLRELHRRLYDQIWTWGGRLRRVGLNIGVPPEQIAMETRASLDTIRYRWEHTTDWSAHQLGIAVHADLVRIHPFTDGNGRSTRLIGDLVFLAAQGADDPPAVYDWDVEKPAYIRALRRYDQNRDARELAAMIGARVID